MGYPPPWKGGRVVEGTALEKRQVNSLVGSNPTLSAIIWSNTRRGRLVVYGAALEMRFGGNPIEGSNPSLSATIFPY